MGIVTRSGVCARVAGLLLLICLFSSPLGVTVDAQSAQRTTVSFDVLTFDLPGDGWQKLHEGRAPGAQVSQIEFGHHMGGGRGQSLGVWPVIFPSSLQGRTQQEHASAIFAIERFKQRPAGQRWDFGVEVDREIGNRTFPVMDFRMISPQAAADGVFLLYFPDDYDARRKFFVFMWMNIHPANEPGAQRLEMLDAIVSTVRMAP